MSHDENQGPPFLKELADDVELVATTMRQPVTGKEIVTKLVMAVSKLYASQSPVFQGSVGDRDLLQYEAVLKTGAKVQGTAVVTRNADGGVKHLSITHAPLDAALALSKALGEAVQPDVDRALFYD